MSEQQFDPDCREKKFAEMEAELARTKQELSAAQSEIAEIQSMASKVTAELRLEYEKKLADLKRQVDELTKKTSK